MIIEFTPTLIEARIYEIGGYKERSAYTGSFTIHLFGDEAWITLLTSVEDSEFNTWSKILARQLKEYLDKYNIRWINYEYKGRKIRRDILSK